ncbi:MFS transporter [Nocardioidaceae bacterium]|nr:MFS transporter [Nocardioidaceae bacterium]
MPERAAAHAAEDGDRLCGMPAPDSAPPTVGRSEALRLGTAMAMAALAAYGLLYTTQGVLPPLGREFGVGPTATSLTISFATGALALAVLPLSVLADALGRTTVMRAGLVGAVLTSYAAAVLPAFWMVLGARALTGLCLAGVIAVAVAHLGDEVPGHRLGAAIGIYVSGNTLGGIASRLVPGLTEDLAGWRGGVAAIATVAAVATAVFWWLLPPARHFRPRPADLASMVASVRLALADAGTRRLCGLSFVMMGGFVATYNYLAFRLEAPPFGLSVALTSSLFLAYLSGTVASPVAGRLADRFGRRLLLLLGCGTALVGIVVTLSSSLVVVVLGLLVLTTGFFTAHAVASSWVSGRAGESRGPAAAWYVLTYYAGSSVFGAAAGPVFGAYGWSGVVAVVAALFALGGLLAAGVREPDPIGP